jgi:putative ABC transport system permease protein
MLDDLAIRLRALINRTAVERELDDEMRFHVEHLRDEYIASGLSVEDATRRACLEFGGVEQVKEECREARGIALLETTVQDVRYGIRMLRRTPAFSATAIATVALSTAALATVCILAGSLFFRELPVPHPEELIVVSATRGRPSEGLVSYPDYRAFRDRATTTSTLAAYYPTAPLFVSANEHAREINGAVVSANFFPMLGLTPALGRFFRPDEDEVADRDRVVVLSDALWRNWFAASTDAIGASVRINSADFTVIGIAPSTPLGLTPAPIELYIPTMMLRVGYRWCDDPFAPDCTILSMIGRLQPGKRIADAAAELPTLAPARWARAPIGQNRGVAVTAPRGLSTDSDEPALVRTLALAAVVLLLVCCANLTGLLLARSVARRAEFTIRRSLGAAPGRLVRQILTECLLIGGAGGLGGIGLSRVFIALLETMFFATDDEGHALQYDFTLTPGIIAATMGMALAAAVLFGIVPALKAMREPAGAPGAASRSSSRRRWSGAWLLGGQAAAAVVLVSLGMLLAANARTMLAGRNVETSHVALMRVRPRLVKYAPVRAQRFQRDVVQRLSALPSVKSVSMVGIGAVLGGSSSVVALPDWTPGQSLRVNYNEVGPRYFETLATPLVAGREFDDRDTRDAPAAVIVNQTLAARLWPEGRAVGATLLVANRVHSVVGVVKDVDVNRRTHPADPWAYVPFWQNPAQVDSRLAVRVAGDPAAALPALIDAVHQVDPDVPIAETITLPIRLAGLARPLRVGATFIGYTAALVLLLTAIGLYGALAFIVASRTKEIGIRLALGAKRGSVVRGIVRQGLAAVVIGIACGLAIAPAATRLVDHLLVRSAVADWLFYALAVAIVGGVGALASWLPARRAARVEPIVALRCE